MTTEVQPVQPKRRTSLKKRRTIMFTLENDAYIMQHVEWVGDISRFINEVLDRDRKGKTAT